MERKLSAVFAADMVGFSRLIEADEIGTLTRQKAYRSDVIDLAVAETRGRIVKDMGDGILAEFPSVVEAVQCAVVIQRSLADLEAEVSDDRRIQYRIGINLGDIVGDQGDIFGDGVNVAARLEQLAEPGGICISGTAYDQMRTNLDIGYADLGEVRVKNIERPIRAYKVLTDPQHAGVVINVNHHVSRPSGRWVLVGLLAVCLAALGGTWWWIQLANKSQVAQGGQKATGQTRNLPPIQYKPKRAAFDPRKRFASISDRAAFDSCVVDKMSKLGFEVDDNGGGINPGKMAAIRSRIDSLIDRGVNPKSSREWCLALSKAHPDLGTHPNELRWIKFEFGRDVEDGLAEALRYASAKMFDYFLIEKNMGPRLINYVYAGKDPSKIPRTEWDISEARPSSRCVIEFGYGYMVFCSEYDALHNSGGHGSLYKRRTSIIYNNYAKMMVYNLVKGERSLLGPEWIVQGFGSLKSLEIESTKQGFGLGSRISSAKSHISRSGPSLAEYASSAEFHTNKDNWAVSLVAIHGLLDGRNSRLFTEFWQLAGSGVPWKQAFERSFGISISDFYQKYDYARRDGFRNW